jgi:hypothetical protein
MLPLRHQHAETRPVADRHACHHAISTPSETTCLTITPRPYKVLPNLSP